MYNVKIQSCAQILLVLKTKDIRDRDRPRVESARHAGQQTSVATACNTRSPAKCQAPVECADKSAHANNETKILLLGKSRHQRY
jgi:hypothetical protein